MSSKIDYYLHKTYEPTYYQRQFEHDLPAVEEDHSAKRVLHIALPFLSLYKPFGNLLSLAMGSVRTLTCTYETLQASDLPSIAYKTTQLALAILSIIATFYHLTFGLLVTTGADLLTNLAQLAQYLAKGEFQKGGEELLLALSSGLYLAIMLAGTLEVVFVSILLQALLSFYQARKEWADGRLPEALAKTLMGMIRLYQAKCHFDLIQKRNWLITQYNDLAKRIQKGREIDHLWDHPLITENESHFVITGPDGTVYDMGAHFHGYGKGLVKGMNISKTSDNTLEFKVNHVHKDRLNQVLEDIQKMPKEDLQGLLETLGSHVKGVKIQDKSVYLDHSMWSHVGEQTEIHLEGLGTITLGASKNVLTLYDKVTVKMNEGKTLYDFHEALSLFHLDDALHLSAKEDIERMKMGQLFRTFDPRGAIDFERNSTFFDLPLDEFKKVIFEKNPEMESIFTNYLSRMELRELYSGKARYAVDGLAEELTARGARGLTASLTGAWGEKESFDRIASILENGMLSSEMRHNSGYSKPGLSAGADYFSGGADTVFTQIVTDKNKSYQDYSYYNSMGGVRLTFSPKLLENGTYQYHGDNFGTRVVDSGFWWWESDYKNRPNLFEFIKEERRDFSRYNEVMIKERIPPEYITGVIVSTQHQKDHLLNSLRNHSLVQVDSTGVETIFSKKVDDFIFVGNTITDAQFA